MKKLLFIYLFMMLMLSCSQNSEPLSSNENCVCLFDLPLDNDEKELILADLSLGNLNGLVDIAEKVYLDSIFNNEEVWFIGNLEGVKTSKVVSVREEILWNYLPGFYSGPYFSKEQLREEAYNQTPKYFMYGIYRFENNPEYKILDFYYSYPDSLISGIWNKIEIIY